MTYKIHRVHVDMLHSFHAYLPDKHRTLKEYLNSLKGKIIAIIPNVDDVVFGMGSGVNYLLIVEEVGVEAEKTT